jgi:nitrate reductase (NAD(P)H)
MTERPVKSLLSTITDRMHGCMRSNQPKLVDNDGCDIHDAIYSTIPGIEAIQEEVFRMMESYGYHSDGGGLDSRDANNPDHWVPRNPRMNRLTGIHPFNSEAPLSELRRHGFITPPKLHIVRNHGKVPQLSWASHEIEIGGLVNRPMKLTMGELVKLPLKTVPVTVQCAGNRRKEQNMIKKGMGFDWGGAAVSTNIWTGVLMKDVLEYVGIKSLDEGAAWVDFFGPAGEVPNGDTIYGASHHRHVMLDPTRPCMLVFMQNGELLHPDHGYPVRLLIPGYIGGRMIKWLSKITVTSEETDNFYHVYDNRLFPPHITSTEVATKEAIWRDPLYRIDDRNLQCVIWTPGHSTKLTASESEGSWNLCPNQTSSKSTVVSGYAYNGAGRPVHRVEITLNGGRNWRTADITRFEPPNEYGKQWCWVFWSCEVPLDTLSGSAEICARAWDDSQNCMPALPTWTLMGMMNNPWFRVKVHKVQGKEHQIWFEHPTRVEESPSKFFPNGETMHLLDGEVASPGWAERMHTDYSAAYYPKEKGDELPDLTCGWEKEVAHRLGAQILAKGADGGNKKVRVQRELPTVTLATLKDHTADNWMAIHGLVYDTNNYLGEHPGGGQILESCAGKDATFEFEEAGHTMLSRKEVDRLVLHGALEGFEGFVKRLIQGGWHEEDGIPTVKQVANASKGGSVEEEKKEEEKTVDRFGGRPTTLRPGEKIKLKLAERRQLSRTVVHYSFALPSEKHVTGLPIGQHVYISTKMANPRTGGELKNISRAYTPISTIDTLGRLDLVIKTYLKEEHPRFPDGGWLSQYMNDMNIGDELDFKGPTGAIIYEGQGVFNIRGEKKQYKKIGCLAGGTGVTPCFQLMQHTANNSEPLEISLLYANQTPDDILMKDQLDEFPTKGMKVSYTVDRVPEGTLWGGFVGFVTEDMVKSSLPEPGSDTLILACGPPVMVDKCLRPICEKLGYERFEAF